MERIEKNSTNNNTSKSGYFVKGWSWGNINTKQEKIEFTVNNQAWFSIPYSGISNALVPTKNELGLEFNIEEEDSK